MKSILSLVFFGSLLFSNCTKEAVATEDQANQSTEVTVATPVVTAEPSFVTDVATLSAFAPESSGIVLSDGFIYTHNDSGNSSVFYKIKPEDGALVQSISVTNYPNVDWEDITADENYIYLGDCGNNDGIRTNLKILKISKSQLTSQTGQTASVTAEAIEFSYSDQTSFLSSSTHNFDCETVISKGDSLYLFTKNRGDNNTKVYKLSKTPGKYSLTTLTSYAVNGLVTGGDYNATTNEIVLIGYSASGHKNSFVFLLSNFTGDSFFGGTVARKTIGNATNDWQTEGIAFGSTDGKKIFVSCETTAFSKSKLYSTNKTTLGF